MSVGRNCRPGRSNRAGDMTTRIQGGLLVANPESIIAATSCEATVGR